MIDEMDIDDATLMYWPIVHMNDFWLMRSKMLPVNETLDELPLRYVPSLRTSVPSGSRRRGTSSEAGPRTG